MTYQLSFYVPENEVEQVKNALFALGAGQQGDYEHACWQCLGTGQFRPLDAANPTIGKIGALTRVSEFKVEMLCSADRIEAVVRKLKEVHPYEEPAFTVIQLASQDFARAQGNLGD